MKNRNYLLLVMLATVLLGASPAANAVMLSFWGAGAVNGGLTDFTSSSGTVTKTGLGFGGGLLVDLHLERGVAIESGGLYLINKFDVTDGGTTTSSSTGSVYVPLDLRLHVAGPFSVSGGLYYDALTSPPSGGPDHGWEVGVRMSNRSWFLEGRYLRGLEDQGDGLKYTTLLGLIGIRL